MTPQQLAELGHLLESDQPAFEAAFADCAVVQPQQDRHAARIDFDLPVYRPTRCGDDIQWRQGGLADKHTRKEVALLIGYAGALPALRALGTSPGVSADVCRVDEVLDVVERESVTQAATCPASQALACLRLLDPHHIDGQPSLLRNGHRWIVDLALERLHLLMVEHPVLAYPGIIYDYQAEAYRPTLAGPLLHALLWINDYALPTAASEQGFRAQDEARQRAWALHPATELALTSRGPVGDAAGTQVGAKRPLVEALGHARASPAMLASLLKLDRLRYTSLIGAGFPLPRGETPLPLAGLQPTQTPEVTAKLKLRLDGECAKHFKASWEADSRHMRNAIRDERCGVGASALEMLGAQARYMPALEQELRLSATYHPCMNLETFLLDAPEILLGDVGSHQVPQKVIRLESYLHALQQIGAACDQQEAAAYVADGLLNANGAKAKALEEYDQATTPVEARAVVLAFEKYGVDRHTLAMYLAGRSDFVLAESLRSLCIEASMSAVIQENRSAQRSLSSSPRRAGV